MLNKKEEILTRVGWHAELENYYIQVKKGRKWVFKEPLEIISVKDMDTMSRAEVLQLINYKRTGTIDPNIGFFKQYDEELAKKYNCW